MGRGFCVLLVAVLILLLPGCPGEVVIENGEVTIKDVSLPEDCRLVMFRVVVEQGGQLFQNNYEVEQNRVKVGNLGTGFNLAEPVKISIEVAVSHDGCEPFVQGAKWTFDGKLNKEGEGKFSVKLSQFSKA